jgi:hypothetical protein
MNSKLKMFWKTLLSVAIFVGLLCAAHADPTARLPTASNSLPIGRYQSCIGILTVSEGEYKLKPDAGSGLWCDAIISSGEYIGGANLVPKVLKVCAVGSRCRIKGTFEGHGVFYWNKILEVAR